MEKHTPAQKGLTGTRIFAADEVSARTIKNDMDELQELEVVETEQPSTIDSAITPGTVLHASASRGHVNHGWLDSRLTFSFGDYYDPERMHFGVLRVLNDDRVDPAMGFGRHPHDNMEIISIPLEGELEHTDSMGNTAIIKHGDIQVMSAGTGIFHSEYNKRKDKPAAFLQIWLFPAKKNIAPRYDQLSLHIPDRHNKWQQILSPNKDDEGVWINQETWFHMGHFDKDFSTAYTLKKPGNGIYAFIIKGDVTIENNALHARDGFGIWNINKILITANSQQAEVLLMEVPMVLS